MNKTLCNTALLCALVPAAPLTVHADNAKIAFHADGTKTHALPADKIDNIKWWGGDEFTGYQGLTVTMADGMEHWFDIDNLSAMTWEKGKPDSPLTVSVIPHHYCAEFDVKSAGNDWYRIYAMTEDELAAYDASVWAEVMIDKDLEYVYSVVEQYGRPLSTFNNADIFEQGDGLWEFWPEKCYYDDTAVAAIIYTGRIRGNTIEITSEPILERFRTKKIEDLGTRFHIEADMTATRITLKADPIDDGTSPQDIWYNIEMFSPDQIDAAEYGLGTLVATSLRNLQMAVYNYGASWDEILYQGHGERQYSNMRTGDSWVAVAYGVELGVCTTDVSFEIFTIPMAEITDDCTFEVETVQLSAAECELHVTPSNPDTRYAAILVETDRLQGEYAPEMKVADRVYWLNYMHTIDWNTTGKVCQGPSVINTHSGMIDGKYLSAGIPYTVLLFGLEPDGCRTTAVAQVEITTESKTRDDLTFEVSFGNFNPQSAWTHTLDVTVTPSDPEATYVFEYLKADNMYADLENTTDAEFMTRYSDVQGPYLNLYTGENTRRCQFGSDYDYDTDSFVFNPYIVFVYGYDGGSTTPLHVWRVYPETGDVEQIRPL